MEWEFDIDKLIKIFTYDVVVHKFGINSGSFEFYRNGGHPSNQTALRIENENGIDLTPFMVFKNVKTMGDKIKMYRILGHFSLRELAEEIDVTYETLRNWENDITVPTERYIRELCMVFGVHSRVFKTEHWKIQVKLEELNKQVKELANEWTHSKNTVDSNLIEQAQELLAEMKVLGIAKELILKQGSETVGEEFVY